MKNKKYLVFASIGVAAAIVFFTLGRTSAGGETTPGVVKKVLSSTSTCTLPPNSIATAEFTDSKTTHQLVMYNLQDPSTGNGWITNLQVKENHTWDELPFFDPATKFSQPAKYAGMTISLSGKHTFSIAYPSSGTCDVRPVE